MRADLSGLLVFRGPRSDSDTEEEEEHTKDGIQSVGNVRALLNKVSITYYYAPWSFDCLYCDWLRPLFLRMMYIYIYIYIRASLVVVKPATS
jgi:hypothetical protein